jgi:protein ImuA
MAATLSRLGNSPREARIPALDGGFLHELHAAAEDRAAALAFALAATGVSAAGEGALVLARRVRSGGGVVPCGEGLALLGIDPARLVIVDAPDELGVLRAGLEAARCPQVATVLLEAEGRFAAYDLTASRRLALAAERNRNRVIVLRLDAEPRASAAQTRWALASAPSLPLEAGAPGWPALDAELLRWRGGAAGERWRFEWDEQDGGFHGPIEPAPLPRLVVPAVRGGAGPAGAGADTAAEPRAA